MSRTLLMAWVARYMTERLINRSRSQPPAASGVCSTREPSPEGMLLRDRRPIAVIALGQQVDAGRQVAMSSAIPLVKKA